MTRAGRLVIPTVLRDQFVLIAGEVNVIGDGDGLRIESIATDPVEQRGSVGRVAGRAGRNDAMVRTLRDVDRR